MATDSQPVGRGQPGGAASPPEARALGQRTRLVFVAAAAYVAAVALRAAHGEGARAWGAAIVALGIAWVAGERDRWRGIAEEGLALAVASFGVDEGWAVAAGDVGGCAAAVAAVVGIARVVAPAGVARPKPSSPVLGLAALGVPAVLAVAAASARAVGSHGTLGEYAEAWGLTGTLAMGGVVVGLAWLTAGVRRLELGVAARMGAAVGLAGATAAVAWAAWFLDLAPAAATARVALAVAAVLVCEVALRGDPVDLARGSRRVLALTIVGGPLLMLGAAVADGRAGDAPVIVAITGVVAIALGASASWLEEPLRPARGAWLDAVARAHEALLRTDPDEAVRESLVALRAPAGLDAASPELWTFDPMRLTTVDAAGYAHTAAGSLPADLVACAAGEPEAILRYEVLEALQVRKAELRPLARWMEDRGAMIAAVVTRAGEAEGLLVLPRGRRVFALSLEEARAIKRLADALAALCHARAALARSLDRERRATRTAEASEATLARTSGELERRNAQHALAAERLARPAMVGVYSAAARFALDLVEDTLRAGRPLFVQAPPGVDPVPVIARAHLDSARRAEPLVVVEGTSSREHGLERWMDPLASPLALADRGRLVLVDVAALPADVQRLVGRACAEARAPWGGEEASLDVALVATGSGALEELVAARRLEEVLVARFDGCGETSLPRLRDRPEDLRAIVSDRLAREGLRVRGSPVGLEDAAFARLLDHTFEGEDAELGAVVQRLVAACDGGVVRAKDVEGVLGPGMQGSGE